MKNILIPTRKTARKSSSAGFNALRGLFASLLTISLMTLEPLEAKILVEENVVPVPSSQAIEKGTSVGRAAAQKYFVKDAQASSVVNTRLLSLHVGGYLRSKAYQWGGNASAERAGMQTTGVTYKIGEWTQTMDLNLRVDYLQYEIENQKPIKISFLPLLTFPDAATNFPIYFGLGAGPGIFLSQMAKESNLSLDYQLIFGVRWNDIWKSSGFFIESGIKDHIHVLSDGQFTSQFLTAGAVFRL
jgi:hypothetical protein